MQVGIASESCVEYWRIEKLTLRKSELVLPAFKNIMLVELTTPLIDMSVYDDGMASQREGTQEDWHLPLSPVATY